MLETLPAWISIPALALILIARGRQIAQERRK